MKLSSEEYWLTRAEIRESPARSNGFEAIAEHRSGWKSQGESSLERVTLRRLRAGERAREKVGKAGFAVVQWTRSSAGFPETIRSAVHPGDKPR